MEHRRLGRTGALVAPLALGTDNILNPTPEDESSRMIIRALDGGINLIDTSNSYGAGEAERVIGRVLAESGRRDEVVIATKVHYPTGPGPNDRGNSRLHIIRACEQSLRRLQTDRIDLYQLHRPDFDVPDRRDVGRPDRPGPPGKGLLRRQLHRAGVEGVGGCAVGGVERASFRSSPSSRRTTCSTGESRTSWCRWP